MEKIKVSKTRLGISQSRSEQSDDDYTTYSCHSAVVYLESKIASNMTSLYNFKNK